jgi:hypothetical protein
VPFEEFVLTDGGQRYGDVVFDHSAAFAAWGPVVVELGQVHAIDGRLAAAYRIAPGTVSHISWVVPDVEQESARLARLGCRLINTARSGPISVAWHDGGPLFPHPIELHQHNDVIVGMLGAAGVGHGTRVLDVGCGSGLTLVRPPSAARRPAAWTSARACWAWPASGSRKPTCAKATWSPAGEPMVRDVLRRTLGQFQDPQSGVVTMRNTFRWVAARR